MTNHRCFAPSILFTMCALAAGCGGSGSSSTSLERRDVLATPAPSVGEPFNWGLIVGPDERARATVFDENNAVVFHQDYTPEGQFEWTPLQAGTYFVQIRVKDDTGEIAFGEALAEVPPQGNPTVTATDHPLVALYTYEIPAGLTANVAYTCDSCMDTIARTFETPLLEGTGAEVGVLLPGLRPESTYSVRHTLYDENGIVERGPELSITMGAIPVELPTVSVLSPPVNPELNSLLGINVLGNISVIVDENAVPVWYAPNGESMIRPTGYGWAGFHGRHEMRILDYTGQAVRSLTVESLNAQLAEIGFPPTITLHHEIRPLPRGQFAIYGLYERIITDLQGPGDVNVLADTVIVVDDQMRVVWTWDAFDHLDVSRAAQLNDIVEDGDLGIDLQLGDQANDWTHMNSIDYDPKDGNLVLSVRHQSWVVKIAYEDGNGDGRVVWKLGEDGDFTIESDDPNPWFTYPHDANVLPDGRLAVYDNGNYRVTTEGKGNSRGQVYILNETDLTATLDVNIDLGIYSFFLGSAAITPDGSYHFNSGAEGLHDSISSDGFVHSSFLTEDAFTYRSFRMRDPFDTTPN